MRNSPAWRASALTLVPSGYVAGQAYRTDKAAMAGHLAIYPDTADDPKSPLSVFAPRQVLIVKLGAADGVWQAQSAELKPRSDPTRGNRDTTQTDPDGTEAEQGLRHSDTPAWWWRVGCTTSSRCTSAVTPHSTAMP